MVSETETIGSAQECKVEVCINSFGRFTPRGSASRAYFGGHGSSIFQVLLYLLMTFLKQFIAPKICSSTLPLHVTEENLGLRVSWREKFFSFSFLRMHLLGFVFNKIQSWQSGIRVITFLFIYFQVNECCKRFSRARGPSILHSRVAVLCFVLLHILCFNYLFGFTVFMFLLLVVNKQCIVKSVHITSLLGSFAIGLPQKVGPKKHLQSRGGAETAAAIVFS